MDKALIRKKILSRRVSIPTDDYREMGKLFVRNAVRLKEIKGAKRVAVFLPIKGEIDTSDLVKRLLVEGKTICVPVMENNMGEISFAKLDDSSELVKGHYGVLEPKEKNLYSPETIDVFFVPGIAFDNRGARLGWGKGYYDKFFNESRARGFKVGACFDFQVVNGEIPVERHDVLMDAVVTNKRTLIF